MKVAVFCLFLSAAAAASAPPKRGPQSDLAVAAEPVGLTLNGHFEGGIAGSFGGSAVRGLQWLVDNFELQNGYAVSEKTKVTVIHGFAANNASALRATGRAQDSSAYFSPASISTVPATTTTAAGGLTYTVREAYLWHRFTEKFSLTTGLFRNPFGMENFVDRYDLPTYYYSRAYGVWQGYGWNYNLGVKVDVAGFEAALFQALDSSGANRPSLAFRYHVELKQKDGSLTPVLSIYTGKYFVGPKDLGFSAGLMMRKKSFFTNFEAVYGQRKSIPGGATVGQDWSVILEPGVEVGTVTLSAKGELTSNTAASTRNDVNLGVAVSKSFDNMRVRALYSHTNLRGNLGSHANELRLLFGARW